MNRFFLVTALAAGVAGCNAQDRERGPGNGPGTMRVSPLMAALDTDHDGVLSADEIRNASASLKTLDANNDGQLTAEEMRPKRREGGGEGQPGGAQSPEDMVNALMAFDKNGDGKLSKDEIPERMQGIFARADADHDGFLTPDEIRKLAQAQAASARAAESRGDRGGPGGPGGPEGRRGGPPPNPIMTALDLDQDGILSADEISKAPASLKALDKNGDGKLTPDETTPVRVQREDHE